MIFPYKAVDLTHTIHEFIPTWDNKCGFNHHIHIDYSDCEGEDKFRVMKAQMYDGIGTHMDAPQHSIPGGRAIHEFDPNDLIMPCVVIDVADKCHERYSLSIQDIAEFESRFGTIAEGSCVMVKTGWDKFWETPSKYHRESKANGSEYHNNFAFPSISSEAVALLLEIGVNAIGIDTLSPDRPEDGFKVHKLFLGAGKIILENVTNLQNMPATGAFIMALPIKIQDATQAAIRLIGLIRD